MITDTARTLILDLIAAITADKRQRGISPDYALLPELRTALTEVANDSLSALLADGMISLRQAGVNRIPAYTIAGDQSTNQ